MRALAFAALAATFLFACADTEPQTSTFQTSASTAAPATTSETKSDALPAQPTVAAASEPKTEPAADAGAPAAPAAAEADDEPEWMKNCMPFIPCFPPDEEPAKSDDADDSSESDAEEACPPFDPICQTNAAIKYYESK